MLLSLHYLLADFFVSTMDARFKDHVPDFDLTYTGLSPYTNLSQRDSSAAAIAASGLVELAAYVGADKAMAYKAYANAAVYRALPIGFYENRWRCHAL